MLTRMDLLRAGLDFTRKYGKPPACFFVSRGTQRRLLGELRELGEWDGHPEDAPPVLWIGGVAVLVTSTLDDETLQALSAEPVAS